MEHAYVVDQHLSQRRRAGKKTDDDSKNRSRKQTFCASCKMEFPGQTELEKHYATKRHKLSSMINQNSSQKKNGSQPLYDILVQCKDDGVQMSDDGQQFSIMSTLGIQKTVTFTVTNQSSQTTLKFMSWGDPIYTRKEDFEYIQPPEMDLMPGVENRLQLKVKICQVGELYRHVFFACRELQGTVPPFRVMYTFHFSCSDSLVDDLKKDITEPYRFQKPRFIPQPDVIVKGVAPTGKSKDKLQKTLPLKPYRAARKLLSFINRGFEDQGDKLDDNSRSDMQVQRSMLEEEVMFSKYATRMATLLHCEEAQMEVDLHTYDMTASMRRRGNSGLLVLEVPGLAESRPSVLKGDRILVRILDEDGNMSPEEYQGFVHEVEQTRLVLGFGRRLMEIFVDDMEFHIQFVLNRMPLQLQHRALELAEEKDLADGLFPSYDVVGTLGAFHDPAQSLTFYSDNPLPNREQACAIQHIVAGTSRPAPYIVFGPPGTGKTYTIVEAIKQVVKCFPDSRVLACAPSNSATDNIAEKLIEHLDKKMLYRMNAASRSHLTIPAKLLDICNEDKSGQIVFPTKEELQEKRVIVCTLITAGRLASACFPDGHFTHVFIDEASQATEPEALVAVANILSIKNSNNGGQLVLAGDPRQLGPILRSPLARKYKLDESLMERLMRTSKPYERSPQPKDGKHYDAQVLTKLVKNYRSHPEILKVPNKLFYDGELEPCADEAMTHQLCQWDGLPKKGVPMVFHAVIGEDIRDASSPSFFNPQEVSVVISYVTRLLGLQSASHEKIEEKDFGIISPYRKQVQKIRTQLAKNGINIMVGSVEEFQGQEKKIIIISSVRSQPKFMQTDLKFRLGFLTNPKRFNVAMTRAKALLVVIGNPSILSCDHNWRQFITHCKENGFVHEPQLMTAVDEEEIARLLDVMSLGQQ